jgi:nitroreductase
MTRTFDPHPVDHELLVDMLDLARRAPSAGFSQGVHFLALTGDTLAQFWRTTGGDRWFGTTQPGVLQAPVVVLPLADPTAYTSRYAEDDKVQHGLAAAANWSVPFWLTDAAMATQNLLLLVQDRGLGALYFGLFDHVREAFDELGIPPHVLQVGAVALGYRAAADAPSGSHAHPSRSHRSRPPQHLVMWAPVPPVGRTLSHPLSMMGA